MAATVMAEVRLAGMNLASTMNHASGPDLVKLIECERVHAHLPAGTVGSFQKVLGILPYEAKSFSTRERNPYMLVLEVSEVHAVAHSSNRGL